MATHETVWERPGDKEKREESNEWSPISAKKGLVDLSGQPKDREGSFQRFCPQLCPGSWRGKALAALSYLPPQDSSDVIVLSSTIT